MLRAATSRRYVRRKARAPRAGLLRFVASLALALSARDAVAAGPIGANGTPIETSDYNLDLFQGPVLASSRVTGLGGAFSALAEGAEGIPFNAAAASQRFPYSTTRTDFDVTAGVTIPSSIVNSDFDNNGTVGFGYHDFFFATFGGMLQHGHFGAGSVVSLQNYNLSPSEFGASKDSKITELSARIFKIDAVASYGFFDEQLHLGGGLRGVVFSAVDTSIGETEKLLFASYGVGLQGGALWRPSRLPLRLGATVRSPVIGALRDAPNVDRPAGTNDTVVKGGSFFLPSGVDLPWEAEWGVAVQLGPRPLNLPWYDEDRETGPAVEAARRTIPATKKVPAHLEPKPKAARRMLRRRYRALAREKMLLSFGMLVTGPTRSAVGVESMLSQVVERSGERATVTMRAGTEVEVVPNLLQLRAGTYMEPTRFRGSSPRLHGTTGLEMRVVEWSVFGILPEDNAFRISGAVDVARDYFGWSLGVGAWY